MIFTRSKKRKDGSGKDGNGAVEARENSSSPHGKPATAGIFPDDIISESISDDDIVEFVKRWWKPFVLFFLAVIFAVSGYKLWVYVKTNRATDGGEKYMSIMDNEVDENNPEVFLANAESLLELSDFGDGYKIVGHMSSAGMLFKQGDLGRSVEIYDTIANSDDVPLVYRHLAVIKSVGARIDIAESNEDLEDLAGRLESLDLDKSVFRLLASEFLALIRMKQGLWDKAREYVYLALDTGDNGDIFESDAALQRLRILQDIISSTILVRSQKDFAQKDFESVNADDFEVEAGSSNEIVVTE